MSAETATRRGAPAAHSAEEASQDALQSPSESAGRRAGNTGAGGLVGEEQSAKSSGGNAIG